jgi:hypothetical protein
VLVKVRVLPPAPKVAEIRTVPEKADLLIVFDQPVIGFDLADLQLRRNAGINLLTAAQTLTSTDGVTWHLRNLETLTSPAGTYVLSLTASGSEITDSMAQPLAQNAMHSWEQFSSITGRFLFYNDSRWDGNNTAANNNDDAAIAPDKTALLPGAIATFANYSSFSKGINGIIIDIANLANPNAISLGDFEFKVGNDNNSANWRNAPAPASISVRSGAGLNGADRIAITWANNAIHKQWLQVTVRPTVNTGLSSGDIFYFGNGIGESGNLPGNAQVNSSDSNMARIHPRSFLNPALITDQYDYNRDGRVNSSDENLARIHNTTFLTALRLISAPPKHNARL